MPIKAKPIVVPEKVLTEFWVSLFQAMSSSVGGQAWLNSAIVPYDPNTGAIGDEIVLDPINILERVKTDKDAAMIYGMILKFLEKVALEQGKVEAQ